MDYKTSKRLKIGARVRFVTDGVLGTVIETGYSAVKIAWDDGQTGIIHHDDMQDVSRDLGAEDFPAGESYDRVAEIVERRRSTR